MLRISARVAILAPMVLCALAIHAQEPGKGKSAKVSELLEKRLAVASQIEMIALKRFQSGQGNIDELFAAQRLVHESAMDASTSEKARLDLLEEYLGKLKTLEALQRRRFEAGQASAASHLTMTAERLRVEIAIERAKAGKGQPDPRKPATDAKGKTATYRATVKAFDSVRLFAQVSGTIKKLEVDIGDRVKRGQTLAIVDVPGMDAVKKQHVAAMDQARARLREAQAKLNGSQLNNDVAKASIAQAEAKLKGAEATVRFQATSFDRIRNLFASKAIDQAMVDEAKHRYEIAAEAERLAKSDLTTAKAQAAAQIAKIEQAKANVEVQEAGVAIALANLQHFDTEQALATINAPFDGVITQRGYAVGDFVRSAEKRNNDLPLLVLQRTDILRVSVPMPESDIPLVKVGEAAQVSVDAYSSKTWSGKVARIAGEVNSKTGTMIVEIDLPNAEGRIYPGMTGSATITLAGRKD